MPAPLLHQQCAWMRDDGTMILKRIMSYMFITIHNVVGWLKQSLNWITWTITWWTNFWVTINCLSANAGKQESLMGYLISFPSHIPWRFLLVSWPNNSVRTDLCPQMLNVKAYDVIARNTTRSVTSMRNRKKRLPAYGCRHHWQNCSGHRHCTVCK